RYAPDLHGQDITEERFVSNLADGPVPPAYLLVLAERCGFEGRALIAEAASGGRGAGHAGARAGTSPLEARAAAPGAVGLEEAFARLFESLGEVREGQLEMARAVSRSLREGGVVLLEAGTGTGKSLAYLVPSVLHSFETGERIIVSTHTKNLQDQLFRKEMGVLEEALSIDAHAERLLGRDNYICARNVIIKASSLAEATSEPALALALFVALAGGAGTVDSLGALPEGVSAEALAAPQRCPMNACGLSDRCPLMRARRRAREARVLFVNHALLLTDYRQGGAGLGPYARVVFDEAHHLETCIIENLSVKASREDVFRILEPLALSEGARETWKLLTHELECSGPPGAWSHLRRDLARKAKELERAYADLFGRLKDSLNAARAFRSTRTRYADGSATFAAASEMFDDISFKLNELIELLKPIHDARLSQDLAPFQQEIAYVAEELATFSESMRFLSKGEDEESVFWLDWGSDGSLRELCGSPLSVDRPFADYLEGFLGSAVFTSATLSQNGSFAFIKERLGLKMLPARPVELLIPSPFPFDENCLVLVASDLGDPNDEGFAAPVSDLVSGLVSLVARRTMVLFTSYRLCFAVAAALAKRGVDGPVLVQGTGESREILSERFRRHPNGLLLGVASFWEGVDFPGEELEVLVIPKIPFPVPTEPIVEARSQRFSALGEDPFERIFLPEAILRMRQGAGRLIRRMDDRGVIIILDSRLGTRPYGQIILSALPSRNIRHVASAECVSSAARWFEG
ncbi:MAG TPA: helicase C-terminal domain-containing protein, partial [Candidatus Krumholzibacteriaceae bacterium]